MANEPAEIVPEGLGGAQARAGVVLLVEDDLFIRMDVGDQLREAGWTVYEAGTADEAMELLQTPMLIDLVLTDIEMPGKLDGLGLADYIRRERPTIKVAAMSGRYAPADEDQHLFDRFFSKPAFMLASELQALMNGTQPAVDQAAAR